MKEQILQKFEDKYYYKYTLNGDVIPAFEMNVYLLKDIKQFISQAIDQTREETIREVGCCPKCFSKTRDWFDQQIKTGIHCSNCGWHEELNKLKK